MMDAEALSTRELVDEIARLKEENKRLKQSLQVYESTTKPLDENRDLNRDHLAQAIINQTNTVITVKDLQGKFLEINSRFEDLFEVQRDNISGCTDYDIFPQDVADRLRENDLKVVDEKRLIEFEERFPQQGNLHTYLSIKFPLYNNENEVYAVCGVSTDITQHKRLLENAIKNEHLLDEAQKLAHLGNWSHDLVSGEESWSNEEFRLLGYEPGSIEARFEHFICRVHPDDVEKVHAEMKQAFSGHNNGVRHYEHRLLVDGEIRYVEERFRVDFADNGDVLRLYGTTLDITEIRLAEKMLLEIRSLHETAQRLANLGHWELRHSDNMKLTWSDQVFNIFEIDPHHFKPSYQGFLEVIHPEDRDRVNQAFSESLEKGSEYDLVHRLLMPDGRIKYVREIGKTDYNPSGEAVITVGTVQDITRVRMAELSLQQAYQDMQLTLEQRSGDLQVLSKQVQEGVQKHVQVENELRQERDFVNSLVDTAQVIILVLDVEGRIVRFNPYLTKLTGYSLAETQGKSWFDMFIPRNDKMEIQGLFQRSVKDQSRVRGNVNPIVSKDGGRHMIEWWSEALYDVDGEMMGMLSVGQDITQNIRLIDELETDRLLLRTLLEESPSFVCYRNRQGQWLEANQATLELYGLKNIAYRGMTNEDLMRFMGASTRQAFERGLSYDEQAWETRTAIKYDLEIHGPDGSIRIYEVTKKPLYNELDQPEALLVIGHEITRREADKAQRFEELKVQRQALVREVHHRIKNHLQGLKGLLNLRIKESTESAEVLKEAINQINSIAVVYGLQSKDHYTTVFFFGMLEAILNNLKELSFLPISVLHQDANVDYVVDENKAVAMALIMNEVLTNAIKHIGRMGIHARINVYTRSENNAIFLTIDNPGMLPDDFDLQTGKGLGTGLELVNTMLPSDGVKLRIFQRGEQVVTELILSAPLIQRQNTNPGNETDGELDA